MRTGLFPMLLCALALLQASCILPVPLPENKVLAGKSIADNRLSFLQATITTRQDVDARLGKPDIFWEDARVYVYDWDMRQGVVLYAMGGGYTGGVGIVDIPRRHLLIIRFDEQGKVADFKRTTRPMLQIFYADFLKEWLSKSTGAPEQKNIEPEEPAIILLHIRCLIDGKPYNPFPFFSFTTGPLFSFGIGSFRTVGEPKAKWEQYFSDESRRDGWIYFTLPPGIHYLAVYGPESDAIFKDSDDYLQRAPRWRIDIPQHAKAVYVGTLQATGTIAGELMFGGVTIKPASRDFQISADDRQEAKELVARHFPNAGEPQTIIMHRWDPESPVVIRSSGAVIEAGATE